MALKEFKNKDDALRYCFDKIKPSIIGLDDYNRLRQYKYKYENGGIPLRDNAITTIFEYFDVQVNCTYSIEE